MIGRVGRRLRGRCPAPVVYSIVMDLPHVAGDYQHLIGLKFHGTPPGGMKTVPLPTAPPLDLCQNVVHLFDTRKCVSNDDAGVEEDPGKINFCARILSGKRWFWRMNESPDRVIDRCVNSSYPLDRPRIGVSVSEQAATAALS